ncbi:MAG: hypothetical protein A4E63_02315 [Syntrophorhabdus sp. PtaU1.Bin050]|jgi:transposase|nr:MAG: hypothetical protein A4E63_02315 [Syntrophorhabdus sp. PtaU1.Bin050]
MGEQIHKRLTDEQMKMIVEKYLAKELNAAEAMELLSLKRRQFFEWVQKYRNDPESFTVAYRRRGASRKLNDTAHSHILQELAIEKALIDDPSIPRYYNYSYIRVQLKKNYQEKVSLPAIIERAKKWLSPSQTEEGHP